MRPRVHVFLGLSLDQQIARADGRIDWLESWQSDGENYGYDAFSAGIDALVMGRATYDTVLGFGFWPYEGKRVIVLSHRPFEPRHGEERAEGALLPLLERLGAEGVREVYLDGGRLVQQGLAEGVVDTLTLTVLPLTIGRGRPLFGDDTPEQRWRLQDVRSFPSGVVQLRYAR